MCTSKSTASSVVIRSGEIGPERNDFIHDAKRDLSSTSHSLSPSFRGMHNIKSLKLHSIKLETKMTFFQALKSNALSRVVFQEVSNGSGHSLSAAVTFPTVPPLVLGLWHWREVRPGSLKETNNEIYSHGIILMRYFYTCKGAKGEGFKFAGVCPPLAALLPSVPRPWWF